LMCFSPMCNYIFHTFNFIAEISEYEAGKNMTCIKLIIDFGHRETVKKIEGLILFIFFASYRISHFFK